MLKVNRGRALSPSHGVGQPGWREKEVSTQGRLPEVGDAKDEFGT